MFQWMRDLTQAEKKTMAGCFGGWSLDALDVQIYSFVIPTLLATWQITRARPACSAPSRSSCPPSAAGSQAP